MSEAVTLSDDALVFGIAYLAHPKCTLEFGGEGAEQQITPRARAALNELLAAGVAEASEPTSQWRGREFYRGKISIGPMLKGRGLNPFANGVDERWRWQMFAAATQSEDT